MNYKSINKKAKYCMLLNEILISVILTIILGSVWYFLGEVKMPVTRNLIWILVGIIWVIALIVPFIRYKRYRYMLTDEEINVEEGIITIERNIVPIERLHKIALESGPVDRIFGLSKVIVTTAGGDVTIRFLEKEVAEGIVEKLKKRINYYGAEESKENE